MRPFASISIVFSQSEPAILLSQLDYRCTCLNYILTLACGRTHHGLCWRCGRMCVMG